MTNWKNVSELALRLDGVSADLDFYEDMLCNAIAIKQHIENPDKVIEEMKNTIFYLKEYYKKLKERLDKEIGL